MTHKLKKGSAYFLPVLLLLLIAGQCVPAQTSSVNKPLKLCDILRSPEAYDGKEVTVSATLRWSSVLQVLYCRGCEDLGQTRLEVQENVVAPGIGNFLKKFSKDSGTINAIFTGKFSSKASMSSRFQFFLKSIGQVAHVSKFGDPSELLPAKMRKKVCGTHLP